MKRRTIGTFSLKQKSAALRQGALLMVATSLCAPAVAQSVPQDGSVPQASLQIPENLRVFGNGQSNVYRPTATVNGEIITATDVEQRIALIRVANGGNIPEEELPRLRMQVFSKLIDETLQIQEAKVAKIDIEDSQVDQQFARVAQGFRQTPEQFSRYLQSNGSSAKSMKRQIRGEIAWESLLGRNIEPFTNVSTDEVQTIIDRMQAQRGTEEYRIGEIYLSATPETAPAVAANANKIVEQIRKGGSFAAYARQFSEASTAVVGGDLGWVRLAQLPQSMAEAAQSMQAGQLVGPIEVPGGVSIMVVIDKRQVLTADARDATLSLKQITLQFPPNTPPARATQLANGFAEKTRGIAGCGSADDVAKAMGANIVSRDQISMRDLPPQLQTILGQMQVGQVTPPFGSGQQEDGVSVLVLCGRDMPQDATLPNSEQIEDRIREEKVNRRAQRYLRDLRRDAVIDYS